MAIFQRGAGGHVAERLQAEPGSDEETRLQRLADDPTTDWRRVDDEATSGSEGDGLDRPAQSANKEAWVAYAVSWGADKAEVEAMSKGDLVKKYGKGE